MFARFDNSPTSFLHCPKQAPSASDRFTSSVHDAHFDSGRVFHRAATSGRLRCDAMPAVARSSNNDSSLILASVANAPRNLLSRRRRDVTSGRSEFRSLKIVERVRLAAERVGNAQWLSIIR